MKDEELIQSLIDTVEDLIDALTAVAEARMPGQARSIARVALANVQAARDKPRISETP